MSGGGRGIAGVGRLTIAVVIVLVVGALAAARLLHRGRGDATGGPSRRDDRVATHLNGIRLVSHRGIFDSVPVWGGAIAAMGEGFLVLSATGALAQVAPVATWDSVRSVVLPFRVPLNRSEYLVDQPDSLAIPIFRATDIWLDPPDAGAQSLHAAHQYYHPDGRCVTMRVSRTTISIGWPVRQLEPWRLVTETQPCQGLKAPYDGFETGGRLVRDAAGDLLVSVGDLGRNGLEGPALAQDTAGDYGKLLRVEDRGRPRVVSLGHRNLQGLALDAAGRLWATEHGPRGGDEINLIRDGGNYGWPWRTEGTGYGLEHWPVEAPEGTAIAFTDPVLGFVPGLGISSVIVVGSARFPEWRGDLLIGTLVREALLRVRLRGDAIAYVEPIEVGRRVRDLAETTDGHIGLWTDQGVLMLVMPDRVGRPGVQVYAELCASCHGATGGGTARGPQLLGLVGRPLGADPEYPYSRAMRSHGGRWTRDRLDAYLIGPGDWMRGTTMHFPGVFDPRERRAVLEYLETMR